jgi:hypothetical protein
MTFARVSGILFLASIVWMFSRSPTPASKDAASIAAALFCIVVLAFLHRKGVVSDGRAGLAVAAFVWFAVGILYLRFLSPPTDIGGVGLALLGMIAMVAVAVWMIMDKNLTVKRPKASASRDA